MKFGWFGPSSDFKADYIFVQLLRGFLPIVSFGILLFVHNLTNYSVAISSIPNWAKYSFFTLMAKKTLQ